MYFLIYRISEHPPTVPPFDGYPLVELITGLKAETQKEAVEVAFQRIPLRPWQFLRLKPCDNESDRKLARDLQGYWEFTHAEWMTTLDPWN